MARRTATSRESKAAQKAFARSVFASEAKAIQSLERHLNEAFFQAVEKLNAVEGAIVVTAVGKPGFIAQKFSATLASTGIPSFFLHPTDALHGDLGRVTRRDVVVMLSNSGATEELIRVAKSLKQQGTALLVVTGDASSPLARVASLVVEIGRIDEACPIGLVPTASSAALHAMTDALAMTLAWRRELSTEDYARLHPAGKLGRAALRVRDLMRTGEALPIVKKNERLERALVVMTNTPRRPGATLVVDASGVLVGIFTDGDLRRLIEQKALKLSAPVHRVMGTSPKRVHPDDRVTDASALMTHHQIDQVPVVDDSGRPVGLLDIQDVLAQ